MVLREIDADGPGHKAKSRWLRMKVGRVGKVVNKHLGATQVFGERP